MEDGGLEGCSKDIEKLANGQNIYVRMEFESEEAAYKFYNEHGRIRGFSIRKDYATKSRTDGMVIARRYVCCKEGVKRKDKRCLIVQKPHVEIRMNCGAFLIISFDRKLSKWLVTKFDDNHNHPLHLSECTHMMPSQQKIEEAKKVSVHIAEDIGISLKESHDFLSALAGGKENVGFSREDQKSYLRSRRDRDMKYGEARILLRHFQQKSAENPYFYHKVQLDVEEKIANIFWADHQMIQDYGIFGDAVSFDTTFRTNKEYRPLAIFTGFNHFRKTVVFGAALLYDETAATFEWLFAVFLHAMSGKKPASIFTDQDAAMAKALFQVMPDVFHGLCTFHIMQNALRHLGHLFKPSSKFGKDLSYCIFDLEDEHELDTAWGVLIAKYNLQANEWMQRTWKSKGQWAHVCMKWAFTAGMRSTQLGESFNAKIKMHLKADKNIVQFFTQFDRIIEEKRYFEVEDTYNSRQKLPKLKLKKAPMLVQVSTLYTPTIFELFHNQFDMSHCCQVKQLHDLQGEFRCNIIMYRVEGMGREFIVEGNLEDNELVMNRRCREIRCTCRKFESFGILCGHAIKTLERMNVMQLPERYILGRWKLDAKDCASKDEKVTVDEVDPKLVIAARFRDLCPRMVKLASQSSLYEPAHKLVYESIRDLTAKVENLMITLDGSIDCGDDGNIKTGTKESGMVDPNLTRAKGLKKKDVVKKDGGQVRKKPWYEKTKKKGKGDSQSPHVNQVNKDSVMPYWPQMTSYGHGYSALLMGDTNVPFSPNLPYSMPSSSRPQSYQGISFNYTRQGVEAFSQNDTSLDFFGHS